MTNEEIALKELDEYAFNCFSISDESLEIAIDALKKCIPISMEVEIDYFGNKKYWCPICRKQQKATYKNIREGCYCERCGQALAVRDI